MIGIPLQREFSRNLIILKTLLDDCPDKSKWSLDQTVLALRAVLYLQRTEIPECAATEERARLLHILGPLDELSFDPDCELA